MGKRIYPELTTDEAVAALTPHQRKELEDRMVQLACAVLVGEDTGDGYDGEECALELAELIVILKG